MFERLREVFRPKVPEKVKSKVQEIVEVLKEEPGVYEVRLFGSAQKGRWIEGRSDIDIAVFIKGDESEWSIYSWLEESSFIDTKTKKTIRYFNPTGPETKNRRGLRRMVEEKCPNVELHIATYSDLERMKKEGSPIGLTAISFGVRPSLTFARSMEKGLLIYKKGS